MSLTSNFHTKSEKSVSQVLVCGAQLTYVQFRKFATNGKHVEKRGRKSTGLRDFPKTAGLPQICSCLLVNRNLRIFV